ncbi:MAG: multidrug effflux MFS transporter [Betaproteobacteria bacterium]|nr:multidrug effflux MFS transporter [Betaproteobacteria bacterium]
MHHKPLSLPLLAALLAGLAMLGPFSIDTYLPSFPAIGRDLSATPAQLQQTLSVYFFTFAVMTLFHGTLSDSFGRRPVILACLAVYVVASLGCAYAPDFGQLLLFRVLQGMSAGAGMVVGRAIIRDSFSGHDAQRLMSLVTMIFGLAPAVAPVVGGWLQSWFGWQAVFLFLAGYGLVLLAVSWARLPETHPASARHPFALAPLARTYFKLGRSPRLLLLCFAVGLNFAGFFLYIVSAPAFVYDLLGLNEKQFAWLFVPGIAGVMLGAFLSGRVAGNLSQPRTIGIAYAIMFSAAAFNVTYSALAEPALPWSVLPIMLYTIGMALAMPSITLLALELFPRYRGMTSSVQGFVHSFLSSVSAGLISPFLSHSDITLALGMTGLLSLGWVAWLCYLRHEARVASHA